MLTAHHTVSGSCIFYHSDPGVFLGLHIVCSWYRPTGQNHWAGNRCWSHCKAICTLPVFLSWKSKAAKERSVTAEQPHAQQLFWETTSTGESPSPVTLTPLQKYLIHSSNYRSTIRNLKMKLFLKENLEGEEAWSSWAHYNYNYLCTKQGAQWWSPKYSIVDWVWMNM